MAREGALIDPQTLGQKAIELGLAGAVGWFISRFTLQSQLKLFEENSVKPLREKVSRFEGMTMTFVTREELKFALSDLRADFKESVHEIKELIKEIRREK